jgi:kynureninase
MPAGTEPPSGVARSRSALTDRAAAERLDAADAIRGLRAAFEIPEPEPIYLDGNSLGRLPKVTLERVSELIRDEWGRHGVRRWSDWIDLPVRVGDKIGAAFLGAAPGEVVLGDSTTVDLYRLADAALQARPGRRVIIASAGEFPTDRYVLEGLAEARGLELRLLEPDPVHGLRLADLEGALDAETALVCLSLVDYRSGAWADLTAVTSAVHAVGGLMLWDTSHAVGSVPIDLEAAGADVAVGCTYKYLSGGPGAPAFMYVRREHQDRLRQPIQGWFGQRDQFAMGPRYDPVPDVGRFQSGTPPVIALVAVEAAVDLLARTGITALRAKSVALTEYLIALADAWLEPLGFDLGSPRDAARRGGHVALRHDDAYRIDRALIERAAVIPDFRAPDVVRLAPVAAYTRFVDVWEAMDRLRRLVAAGEHEAFSGERDRVT